MPDTEEWRDIPGWEGIYQVSSLGRVRSLDKTISTTSRWGTPHVYARPGRVLKLKRDRDGYLGCHLVASPRNKHVKAHQLVCLAFHGEPPTSDHVVAHNDGSRDNNIPENLRWATVKENFDDRYEHETAPQGQRHPRSKLSNDDVYEIRRLRRQGVSLDRVAQQFGIRLNHVTNITSGRVWRHLK